MRFYIHVQSGDRRRRVRVFYHQEWLEVFVPFGGGAGLTFWRWIFIRGGMNEKGVLKHETVHAEQFLHWGFFGFWRRYIPGALWVLVRHRPVSENPVEAEAYAA